MYRKKTRGWEKHSDFILIDLVCLMLSFSLAYVLRHGPGNFMSIPVYRSMFISMCVICLFVSSFGNSFSNVLKRGRLDELIATIRQAAVVCILAIVYMYIIQVSGSFSRLTLLYTVIFYIISSYAARMIWKHHLHLKMSNGGRRNLLIVTSPDQLRCVEHDVIERNYEMYHFEGVALIGGEREDAPPDASPSDRPSVRAAASGIDPHSEKAKTSADTGGRSQPRKGRQAGRGTRNSAPGKIHVVADESTLIDYLMNHAVDEVLFDFPGHSTDPDIAELINTVLAMGITAHIRLEGLDILNVRHQSIDKIGNYMVYTAAIREASLGQLIAKRILDIIGGIVGCLITFILMIIFGPIIYIKSPGASIFFHQTRIGLNGKKFEMYKFRSMYPDAEERKQSLMSQNRVKDGMMFKLDYDPRIIGCYKDETGKIHKGIGNLIRDTSIDEFPQFWNVLKGDMSLVGTRPPTLDEWEKYEPFQRSRMSCKPGITGLWQVSGRSEITDFNEVVRLDLEYIENWNFRMDIRILLKTVAVVLTGKGAM